MVFQALLGFLLHAQTPAATRPEQFFVGRTEGTGTVHVVVSGRHGVRDRGVGRLDASGALLLDQVVQEEGKPARRRTWRLARSGRNGITGTISDARVPVTGEVVGRVIRLRYRLLEGPSVEQTITIHPSGRTAHNLMTFRRLGLNVATVETTIRKVS